MKKMILSVIVPVYNASKYLAQCVESILKQTYSEFELILVDDGSTDDSGSICDEFARKDSRVKCIHIENRGIFQARKSGVEVANGECIIFVDADDWLELNAFECAMEIYLKHDPDMISWAYSSDSGIIVENIYEEALYTKQDIEDKLLQGMMYDSEYCRPRLNQSIWSKLFKKEAYLKIANEVTDRISIGEDAIITYGCICIVEKIYITNRVLYHYRTNDASCMQTLSLKKMEEVKLFHDNMAKIFRGIGYYSRMQYQVEQYVRIFLAQIVKACYSIQWVEDVYGFSYKEIPFGSDVVVFGAGMVGKSYISRMKKDKYVNVVKWVDSNYQDKEMYSGYNVCSPECLVDVKYDYIIIAIWDEEKALEIKQKLLKQNIAKEKIVWEKPILYYKELCF